MEQVSAEIQHGLLAMAPPDLAALVSAAEAQMVDQARVDPVAFAAYVLRDEETGRPIIPTEIHEEWQRLYTYSKRLLIWSHIEAGKTNQLSIARALFELGLDPGLRIVVVSNTDAQAQKICMTIAKYIERSEELHRVFPHLTWARGAPWTMHQLFVERPVNSKDPSVLTLGIHGNILGARIDRLFMDDLLDYENTVSPTQRADLIAWFQSTLEGRLTRRAKVCCIGTAWHREDIMHYFAGRPEWLAVRYPVVNDLGEPTWPQRWPVERIDEKRAILGPLEFSRQLMCVARSDEDARFKKEWINRGILRGDGKQLAWALESVPPGFSVYTGVDLSVGHKDSDLCCLFTICVHPNGDREVLNVESGRWAGPDIVDRIIDIHRRFQGIVVVENNGSQEFILQFTRERSAVPVRPYHTGAKVFNNAEFGIESMATEMANGKWIIPSDRGRCHPEIEAWISEMLYYDPRGHPGDRLMASWFAREGSRMSKPKVSVGRVDLMSR